MRSLPPFSRVLLGDVGVAVVEALGHMPGKHLREGTRERRKVRRTRPLTFQPPSGILNRVRTLASQVWTDLAMPLQGKTCQSRASRLSPARQAESQSAADAAQSDQPAAAHLAQELCRADGVQLRQPRVAQPQLRFDPGHKLRKRPLINDLSSSISRLYATMSRIKTNPASSRYFASY